MESVQQGFTIQEWLDAYRKNVIYPRLALHNLLVKLQQVENPLFIHILSIKELNDQLDILESHSTPETLPLYGVPYVVKDNIDVKGLSTTAACPAYSYVANEDATVVSKLRQAGAILLAKANMDQFATGLVGTRSPYGVVHNAFNTDYISGGSSSGSALSVALGLVSFSLGTDTAGSGRVPAGFNNIVGLKPTRGRFSCKGVVPACRSLDCVSIFSLNVEDAELVASVLEGFDSIDCYSRSAPVSSVRSSCTDKFRFGIPENPVWFGDVEAEKAWQQSLHHLEKMPGVTIVPVDYTPMTALAELLYGGPWVAERKVAIASFMTTHADKMNPVVRSIIENADKFSATDTFAAEYRRVELTKTIQALMSTVDALVVPNSSTFPTISAVDLEPVKVNSQLGTYNNFVNLADCCALALPAGMRNDGLPFGITVIASSWQDTLLINFGRRWQNFLPWDLGSTGRKVTSVDLQNGLKNTADSFLLAVVGAHLTGMPLNSQITNLNGTFVKSSFTSSNYRLYALPKTIPPKPALIRHKDGASIIVELWDIPVDRFGEFMANIPQPLGIGTIDLVDGSQVKGFICEGIAVKKAQDITRWGGWRAYINHLKRKGDEMKKKFSKVLIANRGEIAVRIARTLRAMGIESVAVYSDADSSSNHIQVADSAVHLVGNSATETYLKIDAIIEAALQARAQAIIPGYGFLSENHLFAEKVEAAGLVFVGPTSQQLNQFGMKHFARELAIEQGLPTLPGTSLISNIEEALLEAKKIGYPIVVKSTAGGGGIGQARCDNDSMLIEAFETTKHLSEKYFGNDSVFLEKYMINARHIEVQIFGDGKGNVISLGERDCSIQRRNQKIIEETALLSETTREAIGAASVKLGRAAKYRSAGTIEYLYDQEEDKFYFLEVNPRLQVEHTITEAVTGLDLVEWMIKIAEGDIPDFTAPIFFNGHSMEARVCAEDPTKEFQPSPGILTDVYFPESARVDTWISPGCEVSSCFDSLIAKIIVHGKDRTDALQKLRAALDTTRIAGILNNLEYLRQVIATKFFESGIFYTNSLSTFLFKPNFVEVLEPGTYTTIQDYPGRIGLWKVGVPPSGPMDDYSFRMANRIVGNDLSAAAIEITLIGPKILFHTDAIIALTGASTSATIDSNLIDMWSPVFVKAGQLLNIGKMKSGCRSYLAVRNGFDIPLYLNSRSTFVFGKFGGHAGRLLRANDKLTINCPELPSCSSLAPIHQYSTPPPELIPNMLLGEQKIYWQIGVLYGPHGAPDFFTQDAIEGFFSTDWEVHYNSNRLGIRLNGPKPTWSRTDGSDAGLHPSNIHDNEYAIGSINYTGDTPIIITQDGPSLGGFVCPATIAKAELWKVGQVKPGDRIRFRYLSFDAALSLELATDSKILNLSPSTPNVEAFIDFPQLSSCILASIESKNCNPEVVYRQAGDKYILVEYGANIFNLRLRFRVHALAEALTKQSISGIIELSPGVRSLQINYDSRIIHQRDLLAALIRMEEILPSVETMNVPSRIIHLPMSFDDPVVTEAIDHYRQSVRDKAPWLPSNIEFIRRINGLESVEQVREVIFNASYMVLGLGDVYLGAPCAVPVDPRHNLVTSKYNPARTFTAEGTVGIGGIYMCIYGMDSPGGYQLVGRTLPIWNSFAKNRAFSNGDPWLLQFFDRVRFYPVTPEDLLKQRDQFRNGRLIIRIEDDEFKFADYERFLIENAASINEFKQKQQLAFQQEVELWKEDNQISVDLKIIMDQSISNDPSISDGFSVSASICGNVWKVFVAVNEIVEADQPLVVIESMKMEFTIRAERKGRVRQIFCKVGTMINVGDPLITLECD